ncbi:hypothetical protein Bbelb_027600 [Branchiostoma belcheri]|nr:hypothetical protein Bbelb_027600 [Branchiostoma belcheri]
MALFWRSAGRQQFQHRGDIREPTVVWPPDASATPERCGVGSCGVAAEFATRNLESRQSSVLSAQAFLGGQKPRAQHQVNDLLADASLPAYLGRMPTWSRQRR